MTNGRETSRSVIDIIHDMKMLLVELERAVEQEEPPQDKRSASPLNTIRSEDPRLDLRLTDLKNCKPRAKLEELVWVSKGSPHIVPYNYYGKYTLRDLLSIKGDRAHMFRCISGVGPVKIREVEEALHKLGGLTLATVIRKQRS
jgi:hypothetical protein